MLNHFYWYGIAYFLGSIPFGFIIVKLAGKGDIRTIGSGNIGSTNVLRRGSKLLAALTLLADMLKGAAPILMVKYLRQEEGVQYIMGGIAVLGHIFPLWLKFRGGKGVAPALGVYLALCPIFSLLVLGTWGLTAKISRLSSLSALVAFSIAPLYAFILGGKTDIIIYSVGICFLIFWTHRENIKRLIRGNESKI